MQRTFFSTACLLAIIAVVLGAFGAHVLKQKISEDLLLSFETGVRYQFYHLFALIIVAWQLNFNKNKFLIIAGNSFLLGILFFSGSLYLISTHEITGLNNYKWLGPVTPVGGLCFISGWLFLYLGTRKNMYNPVEKI